MNIRERADAMLGEMWNITRFASNDEALEWRDYFEEQLESAQRDALNELTPGDMKPYIFAAYEQSARLCEYATHDNCTHHRCVFLRERAKVIRERGSEVAK